MGHCPGYADGNLDLRCCRHGFSRLRGHRGGCGYAESSLRQGTVLGDRFGVLNDPVPGSVHDFIPVVGLGFAPSFIALFLYALLPILRNTASGLDAVDPSVLESARGMGLTRFQVLLQVQLPLAWPIMLAGIRVSALLTVGISAIATLVAGGGLGDFIKSGLARLPLPNSLEAIWTGVILSLALAFTIDGLLRLLGRATTPAGLR